MGILDDLLGAEKKPYKEKPLVTLASNLRDIQSPISMSIRFLPLRLAAKRDNHIDMIVKITNNSNEKQLISFEALLPKTEMIGFDSTMISKHVEKKMGIIEPKASVEVTVIIYGTTQTKTGNYVISTSAYVHYLDYSKVINYIKRAISLRVV